MTDRQRDHTRLGGLGSWKPYERRVLLNLAALRAGLMALGSLALFIWQYDALGPEAAVALVAPNAALIALLSADWLEHYGRLLILGYSYNPHVSARGELEGWTGPTNAEDEAEWRRTLYVPMFPDDPGPGHYPYPLPTFTARVRAIWTGEA